MFAAAGIWTVVTFIFAGNTVTLLQPFCAYAGTIYNITIGLALLQVKICFADFQMVNTYIN